MDTNNYIEDYFNSKLAAEGKKVFEERLKTDPSFATEVKEHALLINAFDEAKAEELIKKFNAIEAEFNKVKKIAFNPYTYLRWVAVIAFLAVLSFLVYQSNNNPEQDLFLAYYSVYPNVESPVSRSESGQKDVWLYYEQGNYAEASKLFRREITNNNDLTNWFYLGICELEQNKLKEAENAFTKVTEQKSSKYYEQAKWYMALSLLRGGNEAKSKKFLEGIIEAKTSYADKAKALLKELE